MKDYSKISDEYHSGFAELSKAIPDAAGAFGTLVGAATQDGALSTKTKELIAFAIAITVRCDGCIAAHAKAVLKAAPRARKSRR